MKPETLFKPNQKLVGVNELVELSLTRSSNQKVIIIVCTEHLLPLCQVVCISLQNVFSGRGEILNTLFKIPIIFCH